MEKLADNPRPNGCKKLKGGEKEWRIRIGDYRVIYEIDDAAKGIDITRICTPQGRLRTMTHRPS